MILPTALGCLLCWASYRTPASGLAHFLVAPSSKFKRGDGPPTVQTDAAAAAHSPNAPHTTSCGRPLHRGAPSENASGGLVHQAPGSSWSPAGSGSASSRAAHVTSRWIAAGHSLFVVLLVVVSCLFTAQRKQRQSKLGNRLDTFIRRFLVFIWFRNGSHPEHEAESNRIDRTTNVCTT